jgi:FkbM family methyltransferase
VTVPSYLFEGRARLEEECRRRWQAVHVGGQTGVCRVLGEYLMYVDLTPGDVGIAPHLMLDGFWEAWITLAVARHVQPGYHCLDLGANHGYYTVLLANLAGPQGRVAAVEPNSRLAELLRLTVRVNGLGQQVTVCEAVAWSRDDCQVDFAIPAGHSYNASVYRTDGTVFRKGTVTVDRLTEGWPRVDFLKVDVEGAEIDVWEGMQQTLRRHPRMTVLLEYNAGRYGERAGPFLRSLADAFPRLCFVDFDGQVRPVAPEQLAAAGDWMLWLQRPAE